MMDPRRAAYVDDYQTCERTLVSFRVYLEDSPSQITELLGLSPSETQTKGEVHVGFKGHTRVTPMSGWFLSSEDHVRSLDLRRHIDWLVEKLQPRATQVRALAERADVRTSVKCIWWSKYGDGGPTLSPSQMRSLAELDLELEFDLAFFGPEDER